MTGLDGRRVYLDWNATAPLRPEARAAMLAAMDAVGSPSSVHAEGRAAKAIVDRARGQVAAIRQLMFVAVPEFRGRTLHSERHEHRLVRNGAQRQHGLHRGEFHELGRQVLVAGLYLGRQRLVLGRQAFNRVGDAHAE